MNEWWMSGWMDEWIDDEWIEWMEWMSETVDEMR